MKKLLILLALVASSFQSIQPASSASKEISFVADVWADNWFAMYANGKLVGQDSVPISTVKSFNKETITFSATYPLTIGFVAKDYVENQSGLEYIGTSNQQIGDGGFIAQIYEKNSHKMIMATDKSWKSIVLYRAPLNPDCVTSTKPLIDCQSTVISAPKNWYSTTFDDSKWVTATEFSKEEVGVKGGYLEVAWDTSAKLIWGKDLKIDNTVLFRKVVKSAPIANISKLVIGISGAQNLKLPTDITCDGTGMTPTFTWSGIPRSAQSIAITMETVPGPPRAGEVNNGNHFLLVAYDIDPASQLLSTAIFGLNFQGKVGYTPPCSQGPGPKIYTVTIYALSKKANIQSPLDGASLQKFAQDNLIEKFSIDYTYSRA